MLRNWHVQQLTDIITGDVHCHFFQTETSSSFLSLSTHGHRILFLLVFEQTALFLTQIMICRCVKLPQYSVQKSIYSSQIFLGALI